MKKLISLMKKLISLMKNFYKEKRLTENSVSTYTGFLPAGGTHARILFQECFFKVYSIEVGKCTYPGKAVCKLFLYVFLLFSSDSFSKFSNLFNQPEHCSLASPSPVIVGIEFVHQLLKFRDLHCSFRSWTIHFIDITLLILMKINDYNILRHYVQKNSFKFKALQRFLSLLSILSLP